MAQQSGKALVNRSVQARPVSGAQPVAARARPRRDLVETVWALFCSVRFAVVLNVALALASMLGTVIPQLPAGIRNFQTELDSFLADAHTRYGDLSGLLWWAGFYDIFNSLWFHMLVVVVVFSIIMCTLNRWQPIMRLINEPALKVSEAFLAGLSERAQFSSVPIAAADAEAAVRTALAKSRYRVQSATDSATGLRFLYGARDRWSKLVTFGSHAALVLLILTAALMTNFGWREQSVYFNPGVPVNVGHGLDFQVRHDKFWIDYYSDGKTIKEYKDTLAVVEGGRDVLTKTIIVNDPLRYKGVNFFLVSYQPVLYTRVTDDSGSAMPLRRMGSSGLITDTNKSGESLVDFRFTSPENLPLDYVQLSTGGHALTLEMTYYQDVARAPGENPPVYVKAYVDENFDSTIYDAFLPRTGPLALPGYNKYHFTFRQDYTTILEVAQDPGLGPVVFFFVLMTAGFALSLYTTFTRCWARISPDGTRPGYVNITVGGLAEKNKVSFERDFEKLAGRVRDSLSASARRAVSTPQITSTPDAENGEPS